jgi:hypothetical protein
VDVADDGGVVNNRRGGRFMSRELDLRNLSRNRLTPQRTTELQALAASISDRLPGTHRIAVKRMDPTTGNAAHVVSEASPPTPDGNFIKRALDHVQVIGPAMGLAGQAAEFVADPSVIETSSGAHAVTLQQRYKGIPIFQASTTVRFGHDGTLIDTVGKTVTVADGGATTPQLSAVDAVRAAAAHLASPEADAAFETDQFGQPLKPPAIDLGKLSPKVRAAFTNMPERPTVLEPGPFGAEIKASLVWFPLDDELSLGWHVLLTMPGYAGQYSTVVDAKAGRMLYCHQTIPTVAAVGNVYRVDGGSARQLTKFPRPITDYPLPAPTKAQDNWRWCHKCQALYFAGNATQGVCAAGGAHDHTGSGNYHLVQNAASYPGQDNWRWCRKCQGLYFAGSATQGVCKAGGAHDHTGSGNYTLINQAPLSPGQHGWRWCHKCQGLFFSLNGTPGVCAAGGGHDTAGSGDYGLLTAGAGLPAAFPDDWIAATKTVGNATNAHLDTAGATLTGAVVDGVLSFNPADPTGDEQKILNIFYYCSYMHDFSYLLGFNEAAGNFQQNDFGRGGVAGDRVDARSFAGAVWGTANMTSPVDGSSPVMNMGLVTSTHRHTAFDSTVVFHEFTHGISGRLVGGPLDDKSLAHPQSNGMNEGWSDYVACTVNNVVVLGNWVLNKAGGIRGFPYDASFPDHFGSLGTGRYAAGSSGQPLDPHNVGEIWCATLMEMNRRTDRFLALQLVIDGQKQTPANPSFLEARDGILLALDHMLASGRLNSQQHEGAWQGVWSAFAKFGQGPQASSVGAQLTGTVADFTVGQDKWRWCHKCQGMYFSANATQGKCPAGGAHDHTGSGNYDIVQNWAKAPGQSNWRWCHKCQGMYFAGNATQGKCPGGGAHDHTGSGDYKLALNAWGSPGQDNWRWCHKCEGLTFAGNASQGVCPGGGAHDHTGSGDYSLLQR